MASPFARLITEVVSLPNDPPHTVTIQKLSGRAVEVAQAVAAERLINGRGFAEKLTKALDAAKDGADFSLLEVMRDPLKAFDRTTVLRNGIVGWSYADPKFAPDAVMELDDETSELLALAILKLTKPELFEAPEVVQKKD